VREFVRVDVSACVCFFFSRASKHRQRKATQEEAEQRKIPNEKSTTTHYSEPQQKEVKHTAQMLALSDFLVIHSVGAGLNIQDELERHASAEPALRTGLKTDHVFATHLDHRRDGVVK
jgi:hypothetical protein